jgi:activator of HSP90 ATPase
MKHVKKYYLIPATPEEIYIALTNPATIQLWSGEPAQMSTEPGSEFALFEESIVGRNMAFVENKMIQQEWYFGEQEEPSIVTIKLHPYKQGTSVELQHSNIPDEAYDEMVQGWDENYFAQLLEFYS